MMNTKTRENLSAERRASDGVAWRLVWRSLTPGWRLHFRRYLAAYGMITRRLLNYGRSVKFLAGRQNMLETSSESLKKNDTGRRVLRVQISETDTGVVLREPKYAP
eukprot:5989890-Pleurochrysis_carterae.AAC.1